MPRSPSPERSRRRSASPSNRDRDRSGRDRSRSPPPSSKPWSQKRAKELSFYKKSSASSYSSSSAPRGGTIGDVGEEESAKERAQRRERGEVPKRFGGSREQGLRNTMGNVVGTPVASAPGSFKRTGDPLDRLGVKGSGGSGRDRDGGRERGEYSRRDDRDRDRDYRRDRDDRDRDRDRGRDRDDRDRRDRDRDSHRDRDRDSHRDRDRTDNIHPDRRAAAGSSSASGPQAVPAPTVRPGRFIEVIANDRMGRKVAIKCLPTDTVGDLKKLIAAQTGTSAQKIVLKKWYTAFKDHVSLQDYEINDGMSLEMY